MGCKCLFDFPVESNYESSLKTYLKWYRFINVLLQSFFFLFLVVFTGPSFFLYLSYWTIFLTFIYFLFVSFSYQTKALRIFCYLLFEGIFPLSWVVTIIWFSTNRSFTNYGLMIIAHIFPVLSLMIDFFLSKIIFQRTHYFMPFSLIFSYILFILLPVTLQSNPLYYGVNFKNSYTYIIFISLVLIVFISFELARLIRMKTCITRREPSDIDEREIEMQVPS
jgi:hypothetical protein